MSTDQHSNEDIIRRAYREAAQAEPGLALDERILQAAHAALKTPAPQARRWSWLALPLSTAAVAILVTTVALQWRHTPSVPPPDEVTATAPQTTQQNRVEAPAAPVPSAAPALTPEVLSSPAPAKPTPSAPAPFPAKPLADAQLDQVGAAATTRPTQAEPPTAAAAAQNARRQESAAESARTRERKVEAFGGLAKMPAPDKPSEQQLENIRKLQREGKLEAAKKTLAELRKQFPQYKLPEDLRALIDPPVEDQKTQ